MSSARCSLFRLSFVQLEIRGDQAGDSGDIDIEQFLRLHALLPAGEQHHPGGALGGDIRKGTGKVIDSKAKADNRYESQKCHAPSPPYSMGLLSFMICVRANRIMAAQIARAIFPGVVKSRVWNQSSFRK